MTAILAVLETRNNMLRKGAAELLAAARRCADASGGTVDAIVCSSVPVAGIEALGAAGADRVLSAQHADFANYCPDGIVATVTSLTPAYRAVFVAATATGKDLAPRIAARLGSACAMDVTAVEASG